jgi:signal transduction histidine kinase
MLDVVLASPVEPGQRDHLETAPRCAYSLLALLNDILDLSKIEAGKMMLENIPFNVRTVLEDCVKSYHATAAQKKIALHFELDLSAPPDSRRSAAPAPGGRESVVECRQVHGPRLGMSAVELATSHI